MSAQPMAPGEELRTEVNRLLVRRTRVALCIGLATVIGFAAGNHLASSPVPLWSDVMNLITAAFVGLAFALLTLPAFQRRPIPFALLIFAMGCFFRSTAGIAHGDVAPTAITLVGLALVGAATMPWGVLPQIVTAGIAGIAIAINLHFVDGDLPRQAVTAVLIGLVVSVGIALELERHRVQMLVEILRRRRADARLAQLNTELERRAERETRRRQHS